MRKFDNVNELVNTLKPDNPVYCIRPKSIKKSVEEAELLAEEEIKFFTL